MRKSELNVPIQTIYFGGGTPSILSPEELSGILSALQRNYPIESNAEITLEANPEDITAENLANWQSLGINRLSIGIQSFSDKILKWMNRNHSADQGASSVKLAQDIGLTNISIDLIYGVHYRLITDWKSELKRAIELDTPHVSAYCLTVEEKTVFHKKQMAGEPINSSDDSVEAEFYLMLEEFSKVNVDQYEISNFSRKGHYSKHNSNYWSGAPYMGIGPGAHSFNGINQRSWNVSNNGAYMKGIQDGNRVFDHEKLTQNDLYNECVMTGLRLSKGLDLKAIQDRFDVDIEKQFHFEIQKLIRSKHLFMSPGRLKLTPSGFLISDGISAGFFL